MGWLSNLINKAKKKTEETVQGAVQQGQQAVQNAVQNVSSGYGDWLNGVEQQVTPIVQSAVQQGQQTMQGVINQGNQAIQQGVQYAKDAAGNLVEQATPVVQNAAQGAIQQGQQIVQNTVQNASQAVTNKVNDINNQIQGNTTPQPPAAAVPTTPNNQVPTATPVTTPTQTTPTVPEQTPTNTPTQENSTFSVDEPILSYEDYLKKESEGLGYIKDKVTQQTDQQSADTLKHIDEALASGNKYAEDVKSTTDAALEAQKQADVAYAESQRDLMKDTSQAERDAVYKYAEETLAGALGYNQEAYGKLVEAITGQMEAGKLAASEAKNLLMIMAEEAKNTTYGAAERQRQEAERQADINRQRAIADANSAYEQNKASYGAKAEALGNMGLTAGGYSDWLNASAYAQQRGEVQGARAQSDAEKREAKYTEDMTKLQADQEYSNKKYQAESEYQNKLYDIDTSYRTNMSEAEQSKLAADKAAQDAEREAKRQADSKHSENVYNADSSYADWLNKAETAEREGKLQSDIEYKGFLYESEQEAKDQKLQANQDAANKKLQAEISYVEGNLGNSKALAEYKESLNAGTKEAEEKKAALYAQMLSGASNGEYGADEIASLADAFGFSQEWKNQLISSANNYAGKVENAENKAEGEQKTNIYTGMLDSVNNGAYTAEQISYLADRYGLSDADKQSLIAAANKYASENKAQGAEDKATQATKSFVGLLESANAGQLTAEELEQIATEFGLSDSQKDLLAKAADRYAGKVSDSEIKQSEAEAKADADYKNGVYTELLNAANAGGYTAEQVKDLAKRFGLGEAEQNQLAKAAQSYATRAGDEKAQSEAQTKLNIYTNLLDAANMGGYTEEQIGNLATRYGLDEAQTAELKAAANAFATNNANAAKKDEAAQKNMQFINLLGSANLGELTKEEIVNVATALGLDKDQMSLLEKAADRFTSESEEEKSAQKTMNFISLLDGANTGAYSSTQVAQMAEMLGIDPKNEADAELIDMLKTAATDFANGEAGKTAKDDMQYQNAIYSELLAAANNGDYTEKQIKALAERFGIEDTDGILAEAARLAKEGKDKTTSENSALNIIDLKDRGYITSDTSDDEIQDYIDAGRIAEGDLEKVKEERTKMATSEVEDLIKDGNYDGAIKKAEELYAEGTGNLDPDTYQNAYFEASKASVPVKDDPKNDLSYVDEIKQYEADIKNLLDAGKISQKDYDNLVGYMYQNVGGKLDTDNYSFETVKTVNRKEDMIISLDGTNYGVSAIYNKAADDETTEILDKIASSGERMVFFDNVLYIKASNGKWCPSNNSKLTKAYNKQLGYQPANKGPKHQSDEKPETPNKGVTSSGGGTGGGSGGGGKYGVNYVKD